MGILKAWFVICLIFYIRSVLKILFDKEMQEGLEELNNKIPCLTIFEIKIIFLLIALLILPILPLWVVYLNLRED